MVSTLNKIIAFFTSIAIAIGSFFCLFMPSVPKALSVDELMNTDGIFEKHEIADTIYAVIVNRLSKNERDTFDCLQGLVNRDKAQIIQIQSNTERAYLSKLAASGKEVIELNCTLAELIEIFAEYITDYGYVLYRNTDFAEGLNTACNYATIKGWLPIPVELKETAEKCGMKLMKDISEEEYNYKFLLNFFNKYKDEFSDRGIVHIKKVTLGLRDFAIQQKLFICYSENNNAGKRFLNKVLKNTSENGIILGWCEAEKHFVEFISKRGFSIVPADYCLNFSILNGFDCKSSFVPSSEKITPNPDKHYISLIFSDGDNLQWMTNGYSEFFRGQNVERSYPVTWGIPNICQDICSVTADRIKSGVKHDSDCFMAGPSGIGYALPSKYEDKSMDKYTTQTAAAMLKSDLRVACILDDKPNAFAEALFTRKFDFYSRFDNIDGGIIFLDPNMYSAGEGRVWFSNGKPFLTVKKTLWDTEGYSGVTQEWMQEQADIINSYVADNNSINGYSAICVHAWTLTPENLDILVNMLDSHIEIVNVNQLIEMITENVPHKNAKPD